jgi:hypothetical protein
MERVIASTVEEELKERERRLGQLVWTEVNSGPERGPGNIASEM